MYINWTAVYLFYAAAHDLFLVGEFPLAFVPDGFRLRFSRPGETLTVEEFAHGYPKPAADPGNRENSWIFCLPVQDIHDCCNRNAGSGGENVVGYFLLNTVHLDAVGQGLSLVHLSFSS